MNTNSVSPNGNESSLSRDFLRGVKPIAEFIDETERRTYYLLECGYIPAGKLGATWIASKQALRQHYEELTQSATKMGEFSVPAPTPHRRHQACIEPRAPSRRPRRPQSGLAKAPAR